MENKTLHHPQRNFGKVLGLALGIIALFFQGIPLVQADNDWHIGQMPSLERHYWFQIVYGNNKFVATGGHNTPTTAAVSTDGITWTKANNFPSKSGNSTQWWGIAHGNGKFVAISWAGETRWSTDGLNWNTGGNLPQTPAGSTSPTATASSWPSNHTNRPTKSCGPWQEKPDVKQ